MWEEYKSLAADYIDETFNCLRACGLHSVIKGSI